MKPTIRVHQTFSVDRGAYTTSRRPMRGDIVVYTTPPKFKKVLAVAESVMRVIGLPGDTLSSRGGRVYIDGKPLYESYLVPGTVTTGLFTQTVPRNDYFVMGDNRSDSTDSRFIGPIPISSVVGMVVLSGCRQMGG